MQGNSESTARVIGPIGSIGKWGLFLLSVIGIAMSLLLMLGLIGYAGIPPTLSAVMIVTLPFLFPLIYSSLSLYATLRIIHERNLIVLGILLNLPVLTLMIWSIVRNREFNLVGIVCLTYILFWTAFVSGVLSRRNSTRSRPE